MAGFERDIQSVLEHPVAMPADAHATGTVEHPGIDTNNARGVLFAYNVADVGGAGDIELQVQDSLTGTVDSVGAAVFDGAGLDDATFGGTYTGSADATFDVEIDSTGGIGAAAFTGAGLDDATSGGTYTGTTDSVFQVEIDAVDADGRDADWTADAGNSGPDDLTAGGTYTGSTVSSYEIEIDAEGTPDTFKWRKDAGAWTETVAITGAAQTLAEGIQVTFGGTDNHTLGDIWTLGVTPDTFKWKKDAGAYTENVPITAGAQTLSDGVTVTFGAKLGHTLTDLWDIAASPDTFKWRKNAGAYTADVEITAGAQTLSDGVTVTFAAKLGHTLADVWSNAVVADTYADVTGKTTGNIVAAEDGAISCFQETRRYVRIKSIISGNAVDAAAFALIYGSRRAPNPL